MDSVGKTTLQRIDEKMLLKERHVIGQAADKDHVIGTL
jgi:hypothetical protein